MNLNLRYEAEGTCDDPRREENLAMAMGWLQKAYDGRLAIPTVEGWLNPEDDGNVAEGVLVLMWWTKHPEVNPVVCCLDTPTQRAMYWEVPGDAPGWNDYWADRFQRDSQKLDREMNRGEDGQKLSAFRLGTVVEVVEFLEGSLRAYKESTH